MNISINTKVMFLVLAFASNISYAESKFSWNGFGTLGLTHVDKGDPIEHGGLNYHSYDEGWNGDVDTKFALQGKWQITDDISATAQVLSQAIDDYDPELKWAYVSYQANENTQLRLGRIHRAFFHLSDYVDLGYAYSWVRPPTITYYEFGPLYSAINTLDYYYQRAFSEYTFSGQLYYGLGIEDGGAVAGDATYKEDSAFGGAATLDGEHFSFRLAYHQSKFDYVSGQLDLAAGLLRQFGYHGLARDVEIKDESLEFISIGGTARNNGWSLLGEISSGRPKDTIITDLNSWYLSLQKNFGLNTLSATFGRQYLGKDYTIPNRVLDASEQLAGASDAQTHTVGATLNAIESGLRQYIDETYVKRQSSVFGFRRELRDNLALKLEYERMDNLDIDTFSNIYSFSIDFVF